MAAYHEVDAEANSAVEKVSALNKDDAQYELANKRADSLTTGSLSVVRELLQMPAPNKQAALWKFDYLFADAVLKDGDCATDSWHAEYAKQTLLDVQHYLGASQ